MQQPRPAPVLRSDDLASFRPAAFVFDLDGTLTDNMSLHAEAFAAFADRHGLPRLTAADRVRLDGKRNSEIFPTLFGRSMTEPEWRAYEEEKEALYRQISRGKLAPLAGLDALLDAAARRGVHIAVATSAPAANVDHTLRELGLIPLAEVVVRAEEVPRGKPHPDVFLAAAGRLGVAPGHCLAFEDAPSGITAARAAGMIAVGVATGFTREQLMQSAIPPHAVVAHYREFLDGLGRWLLEGTA